MLYTVYGFESTLLHAPWHQSLVVKNPLLNVSSSINLLTVEKTVGVKRSSMCCSDRTVPVISPFCTVKGMTRLNGLSMVSKLSTGTTGSSVAYRDQKNTRI